MSEHDTSSIPDDPAYWDALAARITAAAVRRNSAIDWLASSRGAWIAAASIACAAALGSSLRAPPAQRAPGSVSLAAALAPRDGLGRALTEPDGPPLLTTLTRQASGADGAR